MDSKEHVKIENNFYGNVSVLSFKNSNAKLDMGLCYLMTWEELNFKWLVTRMMHESAGFIVTSWCSRAVDTKSFGTNYLEES